MIKRRIVHKENPNRVEVQRKVLFWWVTETSPSGWVKAFDDEKFGEAFKVANIKCIDCGCELFCHRVVKFGEIKRYDWICPECNGGIADGPEPKQAWNDCERCNGVDSLCGKCYQDKVKCEYVDNVGDNEKSDSKKIEQLTERVATIEEQLGINGPVNHKAMEALNHELKYMGDQCTELQKERDNLKKRIDEAEKNLFLESTLTNDYKQDRNHWKQYSEKLKEENDQLRRQLEPLTVFYDETMASRRKVFEAFGLSPEVYDKWIK
jgi:regulator of replication initiation timing